jgi:hypothetical protein
MVNSHIWAEGVEVIFSDNIILTIQNDIMRKATSSFVMSVRPSVWNDSAPTGRSLKKSDIWLFIENL